VELDAEEISRRLHAHTSTPVNLWRLLTKREQWLHEPIPPQEFHFLRVFRPPPRFRGVVYGLRFDLTKLGSKDRDVGPRLRGRITSRGPQRSMVSVVATVRRWSMRDAVGIVFVSLVWMHLSAPVVLLGALWLLALTGNFLSFRWEVKRARAALQRVLASS
jgi:hypothetical protein